MIRQLARRVAPVMIAIGVLWWTPVGVGTAHADNLGGKFERCAQLVEFVPPTAADPGHLTLIGIGPGLYNDISDTTTHRFPFSPDLVISDSLNSQLHALANGRRFTCLRMEGDGMAVITQLAIHDGTRQCGGLSRDADGTYAIDDERNFLHVELIAEAKKIIESDPLLRRYFGMQERATTCLVFGLAANGIARSIRLEGAFEKCGTLSRDGSVLRVGSVPVADSGSSTAELVSTRTARAGFLLATRDANGCVVVELKASRIQRALLDADGSICGPVGDANGKLQIGRDAIPSILGDAQAADLRAAIGGTACLTLAIAGNALTTGLKTTPAPSPSPTPTAPPTPSPIPTESASPTPTAASTATPTQAPVVPAVRVRCGLAEPPLVWIAPLPLPSPTSSWSTVAAMAPSTTSATTAATASPRRRRRRSRGQGDDGTGGSGSAGITSTARTGSPKPSSATRRGAPSRRPSTGPATFATVSVARMTPGAAAALRRAARFRAPPQ